MIVLLDVHYRENEAHAAAVVIDRWSADRPYRTYQHRIAEVAPYEPGAFYKREMPCLIETMAQIEEEIDCMVVDGFVWLNGEKKPGLGGHLYEYYREFIPIIGVAKTPYGEPHLLCELLLRGDSQVPLYVTAAGIDLPTAVSCIRDMSGPYRFPTLLKLTDQLSKDWT